MNHSSSSKSRLWAGGSLAIVVAMIFAASIAIVAGADTNAPAARASEPKAAATKPASPLEPAQKPEKKKLTGAELYSMHCNRCHAERYPTERTAAQWNTILLHMRVRANLPAEQSRIILKYLQENSGR